MTLTPPPELDDNGLYMEPPIPEPPPVPYSQQAEQAVVGCILTEGTTIDTIADTLRPEHFYDDRCRAVYRVCLDLHAKGQGIDVVTVYDCLLSAGMKHVADAEFISSLADAVPSTANIEDHAAIIRDKARLRRVLDLCKTTAIQIGDRGGAGIKDVNDYLQGIEVKFGEAVEQEIKTGPVLAKDGLRNLMGTLEARVKAYSDGIELTGVPSGYSDIDNMTLGWQPGHLIIVGARPGVGKTQVAVNFCDNAAKATNKPVLLFSLEMPADEIYGRMICTEGKLDQNAYKKGSYVGKADQSTKFTAGLVGASKLPLYLDDTSNLSLIDIRARARRLRQQQGDLGLIAIDYLALINMGKLFGKREEKVAATSRGLKLLAKELGVPIICLSQLNRQSESRTDKRPTMADLRESGQIEADADIIMLLYRDDNGDDGAGDGDDSNGSGSSSKNNVLEVNMVKHRGGAVGLVCLHFDQTTGRISMLERDEWVRKGKRQQRNAEGGDRPFKGRYKGW